MPLTYQELVRKAKEQVAEVEPLILEVQLKEPRLVVIDVRGSTSTAGCCPGIAPHPQRALGKHHRQSRAPTRHRDRSLLRRYGPARKLKKPKNPSKRWASQHQIDCAVRLILIKKQRATLVDPCRR